MVSILTKTETVTDINLRTLLKEELEQIKEQIVEGTDKMDKRTDSDRSELPADQRVAPDRSPLPDPQMSVPMTGDESAGLRASFPLAHAREQPSVSVTV